MASAHHTKQGTLFPVHKRCGKHHEAPSGRIPPGWSTSQFESSSYRGAGLWSLDDLEDPETKKVLEEARAQPDRFVLKPQREGGGNNLYGPAILDRLQDTKGLAAFILMQRIRPPINRFAHPRVARSDLPCHWGKYSKPIPVWPNQICLVTVEKDTKPRREEQFPQALCISRLGRPANSGSHDLRRVGRIRPHHA